MSLTTKSLTAISAVFILTLAGAIGVAAQTQTISDNSSTSASTSTSDPKKAEDRKPSTAFPEKRASDKTAEVNREGNNSRTSANVPGDSPVLPSPPPAGAETWQFEFSPYLWLAGLHGTTGTSSRTVRLDQSFSDILPSLKFAFMGVMQARKNKFVVLTDLEYISLEDDKATPGPLFSNANAAVKTFLFDPKVGYQVFANPEKGAAIDVLGGVRIMHIGTDFTFAPGALPLTQVQGSQTWADAVVGMQARAALSKKMFFTGKFDLGGGGSKFTYQLFGGLGYNIKKKIALIGGYRVLDVNYDKNNFVYDMSQRGLIMGASFSF